MFKNVCVLVVSECFNYSDALPFSIRRVVLIQFFFPTLQIHQPFLNFEFQLQRSYKSQVVVKYLLHVIRQRRVLFFLVLEYFDLLETGIDGFGRRVETLLLFIDAGNFDINFHSPVEIFDGEEDDVRLNGADELEEKRNCDVSELLLAEKTDDVHDIYRTVVEQIVVFAFVIESAKIEQGDTI